MSRTRSLVRRELVAAAAVLSLCTLTGAVAVLHPVASRAVRPVVRTLSRLPPVQVITRTSRAATSFTVTLPSREALLEALRCALAQRPPECPPDVASPS